MTQDRDEAAFLARVKSTLDEAEERLDDITAARLRTLRRDAVAAHRKRHRPAWLLPTAGLATAATVAVVAVILWIVAPAPNGALPLDDLALLSDSEGPEFYENLDFYLWLEHEEQDAS